MIFKLNQLYFTFQNKTLIPLSNSYCMNKFYIVVKDTMTAYNMMY